jgi:hypothetical protein
MSYALLLPWVEGTPPEFFLLLHEHPTVFKIHTALTERVPSIVAKRLARRSALGRCRVQIPAQRWAFFRGFPTASQTRRLLDHYYSIPQYHLPPFFRTLRHRTRHRG